MRFRIKVFFRYAGFFLGALVLMLAFLVLSAKVSKESIQKNFEESAEYLCEDKVFIYKEEDVEPSLIDRYADSILLNIAYNFEPDDPLKSVMWSSYYFTIIQNENNNLNNAVFDGKEKNQQYLRYWHGSAGVVRLLHTFMNLRQMYIMHAIILIILFVVLMVLLFRSGCIFEAVAFTLSLVAVSVWYVPFSLEYTWVFLCMFVFSIIFVILMRKGKQAWLGVMFMLAGMVTNYLDFLTTETITLTVPLILIICLKNKMTLSGNINDPGSPKSAEKSRKGSGVKDKKADKGNIGASKRNKAVDALVFFLKNAAAWGVGYIGMWLAKWVTASIVLGENVMPYITEHIEERLSGELEGVSFLRYFWLAFYNNISCLFPLDYGTGGAIIAGVIILLIIYFAYVYRKKKIEWGQILLLGIVGLVPIVRFLVLRNHSALHCFFSHRALMATVMAVLLIAWNIVDPNKLKPGRKR